MHKRLRFYSNFKLSRYQINAAIGFVAIFLLMLFFKLNLANHSRAPTWKNALDNAPQSLVKKALSFDNTVKVDEKSILVMQIPSHGAGRLYLFDYRSPSLCGAGRCLYSMYVESGQLVWQAIANPLLPPKEDLIQVSDTVREGFPCLVITQNTTTPNMVSRTQYCYQDGKYVRFSEALTIVGVNFSWGQ